MRRKSVEDEALNDVLGDEIEEEEERAVRASNRKRRRSNLKDDVAEEDANDDEDDYCGGRRRKPRNKRPPALQFFDIEAEVDSDEEEEDEDEGEDDFIVGADIPDEDDGRRMHRPPLLPQEDEEEEDIGDLERRIHDRYLSHPEYDEETVVTDQQALLPSVLDPKLWLVKCAIGRERKSAACLIQKCIDKPELRIMSAISLDHLENYVYVEAEKEAHVREACKGLRDIFPQKIELVPIKEMTDVLKVESKAIDLSKDTWVRLKAGTYKGDLGKVVHVDHVRQRVAVKLIPRIDLQALAKKQAGRELLKKKAFVPPQRFMNIDEARELCIPVKHGRHPMTGAYLDKVSGMWFDDGFLYKELSMRSVGSENINPTFDECGKFCKPGENGGDIASLSSLFSDRKKGHFMKGDAIIVVKGALINLEGQVESVEGENVHIRPKMKDLLQPVAINRNELRKYFKVGDHVKVVSGAQEGATGMVVDFKQNDVLIIVSDTTKEHIHVFSDYVVLSSGVTSRITRNGDFYSRMEHLRTHPRMPQSPRRLSRGGPPTDSGGRHRGGRGHDGLVEAIVKICKGEYKGSRGHVVDVNGSNVRVELESQMRIVTVARDCISENVAVTTSHCAAPCRTPPHPYTTPMRDSGATPIHDGLMTPMRDVSCFAK